MKLSLLFVFLALCILLADGARNKENRRKKAAQHSRQPRQQQPGQAPRAQRVQPKKQRKQRNQRKQKNNGRRRPRVGPPGFDLPDLKKLPNTKFNCDENERQSAQEKAFCKLRNNCLKK